MTPAEKFAELLRSARAEKRLTQAELAERAGLSVRTLQSYESARREPRWSHVCALAKGLGVRVDRFGIT